MSYNVAVDLGTTFTAAAIFAGQGPAAIVQLGEQRSIPSIAYLAPTGEHFFGDEAAARANDDPSGVIREFKRRIGDPSPIETANGSATAAELTSGLLRHVLDLVGAQHDGEIAAVVLTHPANWSAAKRQAFRRSFDTTSFPPLHLLTEPEAAAAAFAGRANLQPGDIVTVYDLGGGTFDTAILRRTEDQFEIVGQPSGIERLGGIDFDAAVWAHVNRYLEGALDQADRADGATRRGLARLRRSVVQAKEALASASDASIPIDLPGLDTEVRLTRVEFETMIKPAIADTIGAMKRVLSSAGIARDRRQHRAARRRFVPHPTGRSARCRRAPPAGGRRCPAQRIGCSGRGSSLGLSDVAAGTGCGSGPDRTGRDRTATRGINTVGINTVGINTV